MTLRKPLALAALFATGLLPQAALASTRQVQVSNATDHAVWVTIYAGAGRSNNIARGCVAGGSRLTLEIPVNTKEFYILREFKASKTSCAQNSNIKVQEADSPSRNFSWILHD